MYTDIFECATFSFRIKKISTFTRIRIQIEFARPHVSGGFVCLIHRTWGRKQYPERKSCGFKNSRIRVHGAWVFILTRKKTKVWKACMILLLHVRFSSSLVPSAFSLLRPFQMGTRFFFRGEWTIKNRNLSMHYTFLKNIISKGLNDLLLFQQWGTLIIRLSWISQQYRHIYTTGDKINMEQQ